MATKTRPTRPTITTLVPTAQTPGRSITVGDYIVEQIKAGVDPINAAGCVGVTAAEFQAWMREGTLAFQRLNAGADWDRDLTPIEQDCAVFADAAIRARSWQIARLSTIAEQLARGTLPDKVTTRTKSVGGQVVEQHVTTESILPDADMLRWKLERFEPQVYGSKATLNVTVVDMTDTDSVASVIEQRMRDVAAALAAKYPEAIEATSSDQAAGEPEPAET